ncbi:MAG: alkaline phosphatase family protein [Candidatus Eisenbacteria bacterium]|nr:alkaline phosphatase family protein [Candidatus Eisenbacteria bacterium]
MSCRRAGRPVLAAALGVLAAPAAAHAYIGPGAGFALISSFLTLVIAFLAAFLALLTFPIRALLRGAIHRRTRRRAKVRKVILLGLDGLEPTITERMMADGELPNLRRLRDTGSYRRLGTSLPALSPVAWSTFATGVDSSGHAIWDFLARDRRSYLPKLSSSEVHGEQRFLRLGPLRIPRGGAGVRMLRKSKSFWKILSEHGVFASVLRVPITFPVEKFDGVMVAGMCVPDLRGSQGSFTYFTTSPDEAARVGGLVVQVEERNGLIATAIPGPASPFSKEPLTLPLTLRVVRDRREVELAVGGASHLLREGEYTPWVRLGFRAAPGVTLRGIVRFRLTALGDQVGLYMTPIHIDPERPAMPISHPPFFSIHLAKLLGPHATLGLAEDTWAMNEGVLDEQGWLDQAYAFHEERRAMWFHSLDRLHRGMAVCVFDITDRLQHMFFRHLVADHPANRGKPPSPHGDAIPDLYRKMDVLVGETMKYVDRDTAFMVMSDHGFKSFRRGVNLNTWLVANGFMKLKEGGGSGEYLAGVDWDRTQAYAIGLGGIYLNLKGRERCGTVEPAQAGEVGRRIVRGLEGLRDEDGTIAVRRVVDVREAFRGPYVEDGPDLIALCAEGYRASWDCAKGVIGPRVFEDNVKPWSGDHCMDPEIVPGVLFTNLEAVAERPRLMDLAPTALTLLGVEPPRHMMGRSIV